jgi:hypothetical protein
MQRISVKKVLRKQSLLKLRRWDGKLIVELESR